jgi:hypothetical protein
MPFAGIVDEGVRLSPNTSKQLVMEYSASCVSLVTHSDTSKSALASSRRPHSHAKEVSMEVKDITFVITVCPSVNGRVRCECYNKRVMVE